MRWGVGGRKDNTMIRDYTGFPDLVINNDGDLGQTMNKRKQQPANNKTKQNSLTPSGSTEKQSYSIRKSKTTRK